MTIAKKRKYGFSTFFDISKN